VTTVEGSPGFTQVFHQVGSICAKQHQTVHSTNPSTKQSFNQSINQSINQMKVFCCCLLGKYLFVLWLVDVVMSSSIHLFALSNQGKHYNGNPTPQPRSASLHSSINNHVMNE